MPRRYAARLHPRAGFPVNTGIRPVNGGRFAASPEPATTAGLPATIHGHALPSQHCTAGSVSQCRSPASADAGPLQDDLKARRARAMERLGPDALAIFWSAPTRVYSLDVDYEYRQDSNLLYLTGIDQEDTILVLMPGNETQREILFIREADARREHWNGHSLTPAEATARERHRHGHDTSTQFEPFIAAMLSSRPMACERRRSTRRSSTRSPTSRAKLAVALEPQTDVSSALGTADAVRCEAARAFLRLLRDGRDPGRRPTSGRSRPRTSRTCCARAC